MNKPDKKKLLKYSSNLSFSVGIFSDTQEYRDPEPHNGYVSDIVARAYKHQYGLGVPKRPWLSESMKSDKKKIDKAMLHIMKKAKDDVAMRVILASKAASRLSDSIKNHIEKNDIGLLKNADSVAEKKGGNSPLIETRHFIRNIDYKITKNVT